LPSIGTAASWRCGGDRVHQAAVGVHCDVRLYAEVPLLALLGLVHLGVALTAGVLGGTRCGDDGGVHDAAALEQQTLACQVRVDRLEDVLGQVVGLQQVAEVQDSGLEGNGLAQTEVCEGAQRGDLPENPYGSKLELRSLPSAPSGARRSDEEEQVH